MPWKPQLEGELPTLGYQVLDWIIDNLAEPDRGDYAPFRPYKEQGRFVLRFYELDPATGRRKIRRGVLSRPRGWGKSPFIAALACAEALGPVVFDGWDADGQPVGVPWTTKRTPLVQIAAVSDEQTKNTWSPLLEMLGSGPAVDNYPGLEVLDTMVNLPRGRIEKVTSSARSMKGNRGIFCVLDQTEEWVPSVGGPHLAQTIRTNAAKIGGTTVETPNAFFPGEDSVAETSAAFWAAIIEGRARDDGLLYDHREAPGETDIYDDGSLTEGLRFAYGDSAREKGGHVDTRRLVAEFHDLSNDVQQLRSDYLNQITHHSDAWISGPEWSACLDVDRVVADGESIFVGFDGSRGRTKGKADATALVAVTLSGHLFELGIWEQPEGAAGREWVAPEVEIDATFRQACRIYKVLGAYADPAMWGDTIARWEAEFGTRFSVQAHREHPIRWNTNRLSVVVACLADLHTAIVTREMTHSGQSALTRHFLNARNRTSNSGRIIKKDNPDSPRKIDGAYAAMLAWAARMDAIAKGVGTSDDEMFVPRRIR